ncbi:MAG: hypothetical protein NUV54_03705, partial [Candidatus Taylorbacteria bacterium]|nr:hypothetical protein [Candidatus Taylorbacteria bacterium]
VILVQKEVAERIIARDGKESILSISVKAYGTPRIVSIVKAGSFVPAPSIDSAILAIEHISKKMFSGVSEETFFSLMKAGFAHKRKRLAGNVKSMLPTIDKTLELLGINPDVRPEELPVEAWFKLAKTK